MIRTIVLVVVSMLALCSCARQTQSATALTPVASVVGIAGGSMQGTGDFPNPGPFKVVTVTGKEGKNLEPGEYLQARGEPGDYGGTLRLATLGTGPKTFNFWTSTDAESGGFCLMMFDKLVDTDPWTGKAYPRLAKSFTLSPDKKEVTVTLRKGLVWSDGKPITADDVVFTFATIVGQGYGTSSLRDTLSVYGKYPTVEKIDDLTVKFKTSVPFAPFLNSLTNVPIAPKHIMEAETRKPKDSFHGFWDINARPEDIVVSGRFKLERYVAGQRVELVRNPHYHMIDKLGRPLPYLDRVVVSIVPDQNAMLLKFYGGELDFLDIRSVRGNDAALMKQREKTGNFTMYNLGPDDGTMFLTFNMCRRKNPDTGKYYVDPIKQKWFNNLYFRQAMTHAVDRRRIVDNVLRGVGLPLFTAESPAGVYFDKDLKPYPQDLKLAADLLSKGGFVSKGEALYDADGHRVEFTLNTNAGNTTRDASCVMIVNDLKKLGIKVNYQPIDFNILVDKTDTSLDWEAVVMGLTGSKIEPYDGANVWKSNGRLHIFDQRLPDKNGTVIAADARDWEKQIDSDFDKAATTFDESERHRYFDDYQKIVYDQEPYVYLYSSLDLTAARNTIGNYRPTPLGISYTPLGSMHNLEEMYFKQPHHIANR